MEQLEELLRRIHTCRLCEETLPLGPNPVLTASTHSKILIVGQAPGIRVHESSIPWNDPSGDRLRSWLSVDRPLFYNTDIFAIVPMAFCYPGTGKSGDNPPPKICGKTWHRQLIDLLPNIELTLLIGQYAQNFFLGKTKKRTLTDTVAAWEEYSPNYIPLPHPSPRNNIWMKKNPWFQEHVIPELQDRIHEILVKIYKKSGRNLQSLTEWLKIRRDDQILWQDHFFSGRMEKFSGGIAKLSGGITFSLAGW